MLSPSSNQPGQQEQIMSSERLDWIAKNTTTNDLIIGDDTMDIPFYFYGRDAASFSPYPYTIHLTYENLMEFADNNWHRYQNIYLVLRVYSAWQYDQRFYHFGRFIADIMQRDFVDYPGIHPVYLSTDMLIFEVRPDQ
jgi:hypothetical protein